MFACLFWLKKLMKIGQASKKEKFHFEKKGSQTHIQICIFHWFYRVGNTFGPFPFRTKKLCTMASVSTFAYVFKGRQVRLGSTQMTKITGKKKPKNQKRGVLPLYWHGFGIFFVCFLRPQLHLKWMQVSFFICF